MLYKENIDDILKNQLGSLQDNNKSSEYIDGFFSGAEFIVLFIQSLIKLGAIKDQIMSEEWHAVDLKN